MKIVQNLSDVDLNYLFRTKDDEFKTQLQKQIKSGETTDYDTLNALSNGRGTEAYNRLSEYRIYSREYLNSFKYFFNQKTFDLTNPEGFAMHVFRNKNQREKAPRSLESMANFVKLGLFRNEGYSPCHNIRPIEDNEISRSNSLSQTIYLIKHQMLKKPNKFSPMGNISFRGTPGSNFEGCQFIYNRDTKKLVTDNTNRGTWDFGKYGTPSHYFMDVLPWIDVGNGDNMEMEDLFYMSISEEKMYLSKKREFITVIDTTEADALNTKVINSYNSFLNNFLKTKNKTKSNEEYELLDEKSAEEWTAEDDAKKSEKFELILNQTINANAEALETLYQGDWSNYISLCTLLDDATLISGMSNNISTIETDPLFLKSHLSDDDKHEYIKNLIRSSVLNGTEETLIEGFEVENTLKLTLTVNLSNTITNYIKTQYGNKDKDTAIKTFHLIRDKEILPILKERLNKIAFDIRVSDDVTDAYNIIKFTSELKQKRCLSKIEIDVVKQIQKMI